MVGNVFFIIIPNQKKITASLLAGELPDPQLGAIGKQRSVHNNYLTLPVVLMMISNHYPMTYGAERPWLVLALLGAALFPLLAHARRPLLPEDWYRFAAVSDLQIAPDGTAVAYLVTHFDKEAERMIRAFLAKEGCQEYQGYLFCKPLPIDELEAFMDRLPAEAPA